MTTPPERETETDLTEHTPELTPLPVTAVTCLEDRAHIERTAAVEVTSGVQRLLLGPVGALAVDRTLHAEFTGGPDATVLDVRVVRAWTPPAPRPPGDEDSPLRHRAHALEEEERRLNQRLDRLRARLDALSTLAADLLRDIGEGAGFGEVEPERWTRELDRVDAERDTAEEELLGAQTRLTALDQELTEARRALDLSEHEPAHLTAHIELTLRARAAGRAELRLSHVTPCAVWRPAYRAVLGSDGALTLHTDAVVWQRTGEDWSDVDLTLSTARSAGATSPPRLVEDRLTLRDRSAEERRIVDVEVREEDIADVGPTPVVGLPGVDDGGEVRVLHASAPVRVPGDGRAHRVPLTTAECATRSEFSCAPELSPLVTEVVRFTNTAGHALLAGPVDLVRGSGFTGRGTLAFTAPGAPGELAFGSADTYRVLRETDESRDTSGLTHRTVTTRTVRLHLSRFSAPDETGERVVTLRERLPVSEVAQVEVRLRKEACSPAPDTVDADGIARWDLTLPPGGRRTVTLVYDVSSSGKVIGV
ncbi:mucoidy inhibitor MuiA family protein [Streptomyces sp. NPDC052225]|uniref:mucoidy inhibitor MuiA family protein n=1 Tax=Streptomyces sp. NPDC052225 TaxID=3154949 RepID=UPI0034490183